MKATDQLTQHTPGETVEAKLNGCIRALLSSAGALRTALVKRDVDGIWDALGAQEEHAALLNEYSSLWQEMGRTAQEDAHSEAALQRRRIRIEMKRLQALQRANSMLAQSFLSAIRKAIDSVNGQAPGASGGIYSKHGRRRSDAGSRLLRRFG